MTTAVRMEPIAKIAAWLPVPFVLLDDANPEPVHVEGGRCALMAIAWERTHGR